MGWNPLDSIKSVVKDVKDVASDAVDATKKLSDDAVDLEKKAINGAMKVGGDAWQTVEKTGTDVFAGKLTEAAHDTANGVKNMGKDLGQTVKDVSIAELHGLKDLGKSVVKVGGDVNHLAIDGLNTIAPGMGTGLRLGEVFVESAVNTAVLDPINGLTQLVGAGVHAATGYELPKLQLHITPDTKGLGVAGKIAEYAGDAAGFIAPLLVTGGATSALAGLAIASKVGEAAEVAGTVGRTAEVVGTTAEATDTVGRTADVINTTAEGAGTVGNTTSTASRVAQRFLDSRGKMAVDGAITGFVFTPSEGKGNIVGQRLQAAAFNATTFGVMGEASHGLTKVADKMLSATLGDASSNTAVRFGQRLAVNALSGAAGGAAGAETKSILSGNGFATAKDATNSAAQFAITGAAFEGVNMAVHKGLVLTSNTKFDGNQNPIEGDKTIKEGAFTQLPDGSQTDFSSPQQQVADSAKLSDLRTSPPRMETLEETKTPSSSVVSSKVIDTPVSRITRTVLADRTVIDAHYPDNLKVTKYPDGKVVEESNSGHITTNPDGSEINVTSHGTESRSADGTWSFTSNKWGDSYAKWDTISPLEKKSALETLDQHPKAGNLTAKLVGKGIAEQDPVLQNLALQGIRHIPQAEEQATQWSSAAVYHPEFAPKLIQMIPELTPGAQQQILSGRQIPIADIIKGLSDNNQLAGDTHPFDKALNDYIGSVQHFPKELRKAIWDKLSIGKDGIADNQALQPLANRILDGIAHGDQRVVTAYGEFANLIRPDFAAIDTLGTTINRIDVPLRKLSGTDEKFKEFKAILGNLDSDNDTAPSQRDVESKAIDFLEANKQLDLQKKIIKWGDSQSDPSIKQFLDWRFSTAKRSSDMTKEFIRLLRADDDLPGGLELAQAMKSPFELSKRAAENYITEEQILATKQNAVQLLQIADANRSSDGALTRSGKQFRMAALQTMVQAGDPYVITQGDHPTCALAQLEFSTFMKHPDEASRLVNEVMRTGKFVTTDGTTVRIDPLSLRPEDGSLDLNRTRLQSTDYDYRSYVGQIFQTTAANIHWQRQTLSADGRVVPKGSQSYEIHFENVFEKDGTFLGTRPKDELMDYSQKPAVALDDGPSIYDLHQLVDIGGQIGGERTEPSVTNWIPDNQADFERYLASLPYPESFPLILPIDAKALQDPSKPFARSNHAISILTPWQSGKRVYYHNTWSPGNMVKNSLDRSRFWEISG